MSKSMHALKIAATVAIAALAAVAWAQQDAPPAGAIATDTDGDLAIDILEEIGGSDPGNPDSIPEDVLVVLFTGIPVCSDGEDNDLDGLTDTGDSGCMDSDGDLASDQVEAFLGSDPEDAASMPEDSRADAVVEYYFFPIYFCGDGYDNDGDGLTDADDPGCAPVDSDGDEVDDATEKRYGSDPNDPASTPEHELANPGSCSDGLDNDLDGLTDEADPACTTPGNDDQADATTITALPFTDGPLTMKNATTERGEPRPSCSYGGASSTVWYSFTPAQDTVLIADTLGSDFSTVLAVWTGSDSRLTEVACSAGYSYVYAQPSGMPTPVEPSYGARTVFPAAAGTTYLFQVGGFPYGDPLPSLTFNLHAGVPPDNDDFLDATDITALPFSDSVDAAAATTEFGEPSASCSSTVESTVWYAFEPEEDALLVVDTTGSETGATVGVWTDSVFGLAEVACASGFSPPPTVIPDLPPDEGGAGLVPWPAPRLAFQALAGRTYYFQVSPSDYSLGTTAFGLTFSLDAGVPPANDDFVQALGITALPFSHTVDTLTATTELDEPALDCLGQETGAISTVWYSFTPDEDTYLLADTEGSDFYGPFIAAYEGTSLLDLEPVACAGPSYPHTMLAFEAAAGHTYFFQVGGVESEYWYYSAVSSSDEGGWHERRSATAGSPGIGGIPLDPSGNLVFNLDTFAVPPCPAPQFSVEDPAGDTFGFTPTSEYPRPDILSLTGGSDDETFCLTVDFAGPIDPPDAGTDESVYVFASFDIDQDPESGYEGAYDSFCTAPGGLGVETTVGAFGGTGLLVPIYQDSDPIEMFAVAQYEETFLTLIVPLAALGGDDAFNFRVLVGSYWEPTDCAPDGGFISSPAPAALGDASCDGAVDSLDATMILQLSADVAEYLSCQHAADVNGDGQVSSLDALLVLQMEAGLIGSLRPG